MASEHKMVTTAEGVETGEQRSLLRDIQCDEMQSFLFSPARTGEGVRALLHSNQMEEFGALADARHLHLRTK